MAYDFAVNKVKLHYAIKECEERHRLDPKFEINEANVKATYIKRAGLLQEDAPIIKVSTEDGVKRVQVIRKKSKKNVE